MPADVSFEGGVIDTPVVVETRRLPLGLGLAIAACASGGLWVGVVAGLRALFL